VRFQDEGVAGDQRRAELACRERQRIVPGGQPHDHAMRQAADVDLLVRRIGGHDLALDPAGLFGGIAQEGLGRADLALGLVQGFALFGHHDPGQKVGMVAHLIGQRVHRAAPLHRRPGRPGALRRARRCQRLGTRRRSAGRVTAMIEPSAGFSTACPSPASPVQRPPTNMRPFSGEPCETSEVRSWSTGSPFGMTKTGAH